MFFFLLEASIISIVHAQAPGGVFDVDVARVFGARSWLCFIFCV